MTDTHRDLQYKALIWLQGRANARGIRAAIEVYVEEKWVADVVALFNLQGRFHDRFSKNRKEKNLICYSGLFEIKVSRSDFLKDFGRSKKRLPSYKQIYLPCNLHWIVCPRGLVEAGEVPERWGLLEPCQSNRGLTEIKPPSFAEQSWTTYNELATSILWKQDFRTGSFWDKGNATREFLKKTWARKEQVQEDWWEFAE